MDRAKGYWRGVPVSVLAWLLAVGSLASAAPPAGKHLDAVDVSDLVGKPVSPSQIWPTTDEMLQSYSVKELIARDQQHRKQVAFRHDIKYLRTLYSDASLRTRPRPYNVLMTADEQAEITARERLRQDAALVNTFVMDHGLKRSFGGSYVDHQAGGKLVVGFTSQVGSRAAEIRSTVLHPGRVIFRRVRSSEARLESLNHRLTTDKRSLARKGIQVLQAATDIKLNVILVVLRASSIRAKETQHELNRQYATSAIRVRYSARARTRLQQPRPEAQSSGPLPFLTRWTHPAPPLIAGLTIGKGQNESSCTAGFAVLAGLNLGRGSILTAGHCFFTGQTVYHAGSPIGVVRQSVDVGPVDAAVVELPRVVDTPGWTMAVYPFSLPVIGSGDVEPGTEACVSLGESDNLWCEIVATNSFSQGENWGLGQMLFTPLIPGDSGSPVYCILPLDSGFVVVEAHGIISARDALTGTSALFSRMVAIEPALGVLPRTGF